MTRDFLKQAQRTSCKHFYNYDTAMERFGPVVEGHCLINAKCLKCNQVVTNYEADERIQEIVDVILKVGATVPLEKRYGLEAASFVSDEIYCYHEKNGEMTIIMNNPIPGNCLARLRLAIYPGGNDCSLSFYNRKDLETFKDTVAVKADDLGSLEDNALLLSVRMKDFRRFKQFLETLISHNKFDETSQNWIERYMTIVNKNVR